MNDSSNNYKLFDEDLKIKNESIAAICLTCNKYSRRCKGRKTYDSMEIEFCPDREKIKKR